MGQAEGVIPPLTPSPDFLSHKWGGLPSTLGMAPLEIVVTSTSTTSLVIRVTTASRKETLGTSLVVQWLRLRAPNAGGPGSIPGQETRSHMHATTKSLHATTREPVSHN